MDLFDYDEYEEGFMLMHALDYFNQDPDEYDEDSMDSDDSVIMVSSEDDYDEVDDGYGVVIDHDNADETERDSEDRDDDSESDEFDEQLNPDPSAENSDNRPDVDASDICTASDPNDAPACDSACQTTPGLTKGGDDKSSRPTQHNASFDADKRKRDNSAEEDQGCPICFEPWSNSGSHRLSSLLCGHLFGRSCIERWLKGKNVDKCPQCNHPAKRKDIRNIYAKAIKAIDTAERDKALMDLQDERTKRTKAEQEKARAILQYELAKAEIQALKEQVQNQAKMSQTYHGDRVSSQMCPESTEYNDKRSFVLQRSMPISQGNARVITYDYCRGILAVSKPSPNQLFPGYGVVKVSSLESRSSEYVNIHQKTIRDASFCNQGDLLLTGSIDKTLKVTSVSCNAVVQSYACPSPVWSCAWHCEDSNYVYGGLQNGSCLLFDLRNTTAHVKDLKPANEATTTRPIVSMSYVPPQASSNFSPQGLLVGTLTGGYFLENTEADYLPYVLPFPEGSCTCLSFNDATRHCMLSLRPSKTYPKTRHLVYEMTGSGIGDRLSDVASTSRDTTVCSCRAVGQCIGGSMNKLLTRATLFSFPGNDKQLFSCAGDESACGALVWNARSGSVLQKIAAPPTEQYVDVLPFTVNNDNYLSCITEYKLTIHKWTT